MIRWRQTAPRERRRQVAARLGMGWLIAVGPSDACLSLVAVRDGGEAATARKESRRVRARLAAEGDVAIAACSIRLELCFASVQSATRIRRAALDALAPDRRGGDVLRVPVATVERTIREAARAAGVGVWGRVERDRRIDAEMLRTW